MQEGICSNRFLYSFFKRARSWFFATRPKTLTTSFIPVLLGLTIAIKEGGIVTFYLGSFVLLTAFSIHIGTNLVNDAFDFKKGADTLLGLSPLRATQTGEISADQFLTAGILFFFLASLFSIPLVLEGGIVIFLAVVFSILSGYYYTGGPYPLAYLGLGDFFVFLFFGPIATLAVGFLFLKTTNVMICLFGIEIGLLSLGILSINNLRDLEDDTFAKKRTLAVRWGESFVKKELAIVLLVPYLLHFSWAFTNKGFPITLLPLLTLPLALHILKQLWKTKPSTLYNHYLEKCALLHFSYGILAAISIVVK